MFAIVSSFQHNLLYDSWISLLLIEIEKIIIDQIFILQHRFSVNSKYIELNIMKI